MLGEIPLFLHPASAMTDLTPDKLLPLLHAHAAAFMASDPNLSTEAAVARSCALAVVIYDLVSIEAALRAAAQRNGVPDTLALIVGNQSGGATAALTPPP